MACRDLDVDLLFVELALAQLLAEVLARGRFFVLLVSYKNVQYPVLCRIVRVRAHAAHRLLARLLDADLDQVPDDRVDVAPDIADLGELRRLDLDERRVGEAREPARD